MGNILIVDDDKMICDTIQRLVQDMGHRVQCADTLENGIFKAEKGEFDIVLLDVRLPDGNGLTSIQTFQNTSSGPEIIIMTGYADARGAELAVNNKAWDYIRKPASIEAITLTLNRALLYRSEKVKNLPGPDINRDEIIGKSPEIMACLELAAKAAQNTANILITGETGTGKELFARAIHKNSQRSENRFVVVDCTALPETLAESLLLGHTKGAFTGAGKDEEGFVMYANGGTLFLDEIGELPVTMQKGFLRVLQERRFTPIGGTREVVSDFRLICATNRDLDQLSTEKGFREDLLFRIRSITINLPPLRERTGDIRPLTSFYLQKLCDTNHTEPKAMSPDFLEVLNLYQWPGNIRELYSCLEYAFFHGQYESTLFPKHLPNHIRVHVFKNLFDESEDDLFTGADHHGKDRDVGAWKTYRRMELEKAERSYLARLMRQNSGNIRSAARVSGLSASRLYDLLKKHNISVQPF